MRRFSLVKNKSSTSVQRALDTQVSKDEEEERSSTPLNLLAKKEVSSTCLIFFFSSSDMISKEKEIDFLLPWHESTYSEFD